MPRDAAPRPIVAAELLSIGSELTTGETRDTNGGELARGLSTRGVAVLRIQALPDDLEVVTGAFAVALPGPPREMRPMWADWVLPRLDARGPGRDQEVRTLRLTGIGESQVADRLGESMLRAPNPVIATYARSDAVDVRIAARPDDG